MENFEKTTHPSPEEIKQKIWNETRNKVENYADSTGLGIDEGIKESVTAFNVNGLPTEQSCEGHDFSYGSGYHMPWPWVRVVAPNEPSERFVGEKALYEETEEYKKWDEQNTILLEKAQNLLAEFYKIRKADPEVEIITDVGAGHFEVRSRDNREIKHISGELTNEEKADLMRLLPLRQLEMKAFTEFLKQKFLNPETFNLSEDVQEQLENFGLTPEQITGDVLDIGAGEGEFAKNFKNKDGVKIVSVDKVVEDENSEVIACDVRELPFKDESFDLILSHASIPNVFINMYSEEFPDFSKKAMKQSLNKAFNQIIRVLKPSGEVRLAPVRLAENYESEKVMKAVFLDVVKELQDIGLNVIVQHLKTLINPENNEKSEIYRMIIRKEK